MHLMIMSVQPVKVIMCAYRICVKSHGSLTMIRILLMLEECDWLGGNRAKSCVSVDNF